MKNMSPKMWKNPQEKIHYLCSITPLSHIKLIEFT